MGYHVRSLSIWRDVSCAECQAFSCSFRPDTPSDAQPSHARVRAKRKQARTSNILAQRREFKRRRSLHPEASSLWPSGQALASFNVRYFLKR
jgi:hypothetical protein